MGLSLMNMLGLIEGGDTDHYTTEDSLKGLWKVYLYRIVKCTPTAMEHVCWDTKMKDVSMEMDSWKPTP
jgi:hypothetical protein